MPATSPAQRFRVALDMAETGVELMRANLRRRHPDEPARSIDRRWREWLRRRPLDAPGRTRPLGSD